MCVCVLGVCVCGRHSTLILISHIYDVYHVCVWCRGEQGEGMPLPAMFAFMHALSDTGPLADDFDRFAFEKSPMTKTKQTRTRTKTNKLNINQNKKPTTKTNNLK